MDYRRGSRSPSPTEVVETSDCYGGHGREEGERPGKERDSGETSW